MPPPSAGILLFRRGGKKIEVLLIKPGGPFWRNKDAGAWMIPKGAIEPGETSADAALREFEEEIGHPLDRIPVHLCSIRQSGGKLVEVFAAEGDVDAAAISSIHSRAGSPNGAPHACRSSRMNWAFGTGTGAATLTAPVRRSWPISHSIALTKSS